MPPLMVTPAMVALLPPPVVLALVRPVWKTRSIWPVTSEAGEPLVQLAELVQRLLAPRPVQSWTVGVSRSSRISRRRRLRDGVLTAERERAKSARNQEEAMLST